MKIGYKTYKKPTYYVVKQTANGFEFVLPGKSTLESAKKDAMNLAGMSDYPDFKILKVLGKIMYM